MGCLNCRNNSVYSKIDFLCPECGKLSPEISNIGADNKVVRFKCKICAENEYKSEFFYKKEFLSDNIIEYYCKEEKGNFEDKYWFKIDSNQNHRLTGTKNSLLNIITDKEFNDYKEKIRKKTEQLENILKFNEKLIDEAEKNSNNYFYLKSLDNISKSFLNEQKRDLKDLKFLTAAFKNDFEISKKAIDSFSDEKEDKIEREKEYLLLNGKNLNDENIKCISLIQFNNLKEIDLSKNEITNIEALCDINLPFLEYLNLSNNKIKEIEPLKEIISKSFKYLFIHNNLIEDIQILYDPNFRIFEILTIENNHFNQPAQLEELLSLYKKNEKILVTKIDEIKEKYNNLIYNEQNLNLELKDTNEGDSMLKNLFIIITYNNNFKIITLNLGGNKIEDPSILNRIQLNQLVTLDLSANNIKSLDFLKGMKSEHLNNLYLDNNYINDLSFLYNIKKFRKKFPDLKLVSLKNNNFEPNSLYCHRLTNIARENNINCILNDENQN